MNKLSLREYVRSEGIEMSSEDIGKLKNVFPSIDASLTPRDGVWDLTGGHHVGVMQTPLWSVMVSPKVEIRSLFFMLSYALDPTHWKDNMFDWNEESTILDVLVPGFLRHLWRALGRGPLQGYKTIEDSGTFVRGRIRFDEQLRRWQGRVLPLEVRYDEFTEDIEVNRLLLAALFHLQRLPLRDSKMRHQLNHYHRMLSESVSLVEYRGELPEIQWDSLNAHYRPAVELAKLIIRNSSFRFETGTNASSSFVIDMNDAFEEFVRVALRESLATSAAQFPPPSELAGLYLDESAKIRLRPDLSWWQSGKCVFVGDAKYKSLEFAGFRHPDVYQLLGYTTSLNLRHGMLIYAKGKQQRASFDIRNTDKTVLVRTLDLDHEPDEVLAQIDQLAIEIRALAEAAKFNEADRLAI